MNDFKKQNYNKSGQKINLDSEPSKICQFLIGTYHLYHHYEKVVRSYLELTMNFEHGTKLTLTPSSGSSSRPWRPRLVLSMVSISSRLIIPSPLRSQISKQYPMCSSSLPSIKGYLINDVTIKAANLKIVFRQYYCVIQN